LLVDRHWKRELDICWVYYFDKAQCCHLKFSFITWYVFRNNFFFVCFHHRTYLTRHVITYGRKRAEQTLVKYMGPLSKNEEKILKITCYYSMKLFISIFFLHDVLITFKFKVSLFKWDFHYNFMALGTFENELAKSQRSMMANVSQYQKNHTCMHQWYRPAWRCLHSQCIFLF
jgi:hypothetical protein